jgi:hypothetical protein
MTTMKQFRWFWAWDDEKEENWLREMSNKGWHYKQYTLPGNYTFEHGEPRDYVYRLDYFREFKGKEDYLQLFLDAGWEYLGEVNNWQYFRKEKTGDETPEIFSDAESKVKKYQRILVILVVIFPIFASTLNLMNRQPGSFYQGFTFAMMLLMFFYIYAMTRLIMRVTQLKKKI